MNHQMTATSGVRARRSQEERSNETRRKVVAATVNLLNERGYAAATTAAVAEIAGVSRGALLHQYPTRIDLMIDVVRTVKESELQFFLGAIEAIDNPSEKLFAMPAILWELGKRPEGMALIEIQLGSRSDCRLSLALGPVQRQIDEYETKELARIMAHTGISKAVPDPMLIQLIGATIRGLIIERAFRFEHDALDAAVEQLQAMIMDAIRHSLD